MSLKNGAIRVSTIDDVMIRNPKTLAAHASIEEARVALANNRVHMVLLVNACELVGTLVRADLADVNSGAGPALPWSTLVGRTVPPDAEFGTVQRLLAERGLRRLAVVDPEGALVGLVCLKRSRTGFCSDADVQSRAQDTWTPGHADAHSKPIVTGLSDVRVLPVRVTGDPH